MNTNKKIVYTLFISVIFCLSFITQQPMKVSADDDDINFDLIILDAYYGDFDDDRLFDDVRILLAIDIQIDDYDDYDDFEDEIINVVLKTEIVLPSGLKYKGTLKFSTLYDNRAIIVLITALNTANESGWYDTEIEGFIMFNQEFYTPSDSFIFDPPTQGPPGGEPLFLFALL